MFVRLWLLAVALFVVGYAQYQASFPAYATGTGGIGSHALGVAFAANTFGVAAFQLFVLRLLTGLRRTTAVALGALGWACAWGITIAAAHAGGGAAAVAGFALAMAVFALGECCLSPTLGPIANDLAPDRLRGRYNGALALAYTTGYTIGPLLAGVSLKAGDGTPFFVALVAACVAAALATRGLRRLLPDEIDVLAPV